LIVEYTVYRHHFLLVPLNIFSYLFLVGEFHWKCCNDAVEEVRSPKINEDPFEQVARAD